MRALRMHARRGDALLAVLAGVLAWAAFSGYSTLSPMHVGWVVHNLDMPQHYAGWLYFRHAPWRQWPLGMNPHFGYDAPSSIVMTDSIPLLALLFKPFSAWLALRFQYFGVWLLACFLLQAWFAFALLRRFSPSRLFCFAGTLFFATASIFIARIYIHPALSGQWLLLAALNLHFSASTRRRRGWLALLLVAAGIHAYLLVMVGCIWSADLLQRACRRSAPGSSLLGETALGIATTALAMWGLGYFVAAATIPVDTAHQTFANLLFPFWTGANKVDPGWSFGLQGIGTPMVPFKDAFLEGDGIGYFGLGYLALVVFALALAWRPRILEVVPAPAWTLVAIACAAMLLFSFGDTWHAGSQILLHLPDHVALDGVRHIFRGCGRFMWPAWYLCMLATFHMIATRLPPRTAALLVFGLLLVQMYDLHGKMHQYWQQLAAHRSGKSELTSGIWSELARHNARIAVVSGFDPPDALYLQAQYKELMLFGARNDLALSTGWLAHTDTARLLAFDHSRAQRLLAQDYEEDTFYTVFDESVWALARCQHSVDAWVGTVNGINLVVPGGMHLPELAQQPHATCP